MTTTYKNYDFFPKMKAAAAAKYGADGFLIRNDDGMAVVFYPPTLTKKIDPILIEEGWFDEPQHHRDGDRYVGGGEVWEAVPNPGWPLKVEFSGREYALANIAKGGGSFVALYRPDDPTAGGICARLTDSGLDVWNPRALAAELAARPFPAVLGRNYLDCRTFPDALADKGITAKVTELGRYKGTLYRVEYEVTGQPHLAYEHIEAGADSFCSGSVVLAEPVIPDERDLDWLYRLVLGREQRQVKEDDE